MNSNTMATTQSRREESTIRPMRVLVVEPRPMVAPMLRRWLAQRGHTLNVADAAESGFTQAVACRPDTVLVDLALGTSSASTLANRLRTHPITRTTALVAIGEPAVVAAGAGTTLFRRHVLKPIDVDELGAVLLDTAPPHASPSVACATAGG